MATLESNNDPAPLPPALCPVLSCVEERRRRTMGSEHPPLFQSWLWVRALALLRVMCKWPWSLRAWTAIVSAGQISQWEELAGAHKTQQDDEGLGEKCAD